MEEYSLKGDDGIFLRQLTDLIFAQNLRNALPFFDMQDSPELRRHLAFRDYLRTHPEAAKEYGRVKMEGAALYPDDVEKYITHKTPFIEKVYARIL